MASEDLNDLNPSFRQTDLTRKLFTLIHVRVLSFGEGLFESEKLRAVERSSLPASTASRGIAKRTDF